jgi:hypothetical protein
VVNLPKNTIFSIEPSEYGWIVKNGAASLGLFVSQRHALNDVRKRQRALKNQGRQSSVAVTVEYPEDASDRRAHNYWSQRKVR